MERNVFVFSYSKELRDLYAEMIEDEGYKVYPLLPTAENIEKIADVEFPFILIDITEPDCDVGPFLFSWLQEHRKIPRLFLYNKYLNAVHVQKYIQEQSVPTLNKPFHLDCLLNAIHRGFCASGVK